MALPILAALAPSILKTLYGIGGALSYSGAERAKYKIPTGISEAEGIYKYLSGAEVSGVREAENNIFQSQSNTIDSLLNNVDSGSALLNSVGKIQGITNESLTNLAVNSSREKKLNQKNLADFLGSTKASAEDKEWQINEQQPFLDEAKAAQMGVQNTFGGISEIGKGALDINQADIFNQLTAETKKQTNLLTEDLKLRSGAGNDITQTQKPPDISPIVSAITSTLLKSANSVTSNANDNVAAMLGGSYVPQQSAEEIASENINKLDFASLIGNNIGSGISPNLMNAEKNGITPSTQINSPVVDNYSNPNNLQSIVGDKVGSGSIPNLGNADKIYNKPNDFIIGSSSPIDSFVDMETLKRDETTLTQLPSKSSVVTPNKKKQILNGKIIETSDNGDAFDKLKGQIKTQTKEEENLLYTTPVGVSSPAKKQVINTVRDESNKEYETELEYFKTIFDDSKIIDYTTNPNVNNETSTYKMIDVGGRLVDAKNFDVAKNLIKSDLDHFLQEVDEKSIDELKRDYPHFIKYINGEKSFNELAKSVGFSRSGYNIDKNFGEIRQLKTNNTK